MESSDELGSVFCLSPQMEFHLASLTARQVRTKLIQNTSLLLYTIKSHFLPNRQFQPWVSTFCRCQTWLQQLNDFLDRVRSVADERERYHLYGEAFYACVLLFYRAALQYMSCVHKIAQKSPPLVLLPALKNVLAQRLTTIINNSAIRVFQSFG